jgi:hypothetical protein
VTSCNSISKKEEVKNLDFMGKTNFFLCTLPFSPWAVLATWLHVGVPQKIQEKELYTPFEQNFTTCSYRVGIGRAWCSRKACEICSSLVQKKKMKKIYFSSHKLPKQQSTSLWSQGILGIKGLLRVNKYYFISQAMGPSWYSFILVVTVGCRRHFQCVWSKQYICRIWVESNLLTNGEPMEVAIVKALVDPLLQNQFLQQSKLH